MTSETQFQSRWFFLGLMVGSIAVLFQNCAGGFEAMDSSGASISSFGSNVLLLSGNHSANAAGIMQVSKGETFRVMADLAKYPDGSTFLWDNVYSDGMTYCDQTSLPDKSATDFSCPTDGMITISFMATKPSGDSVTSTLQLLVGDPATTPTPSPTPGPSATPTPTPAPASGAQLYTNNCSGCHGPLATSSKHGITRAQLDQAIATVPAMAGLANLSSSDRDAIVAALQ